MIKFKKIAQSLKDVMVVQMNTTPGDFTGNCRKIKESIEFAGQKNKKILLFPEMVIPGYLVGDLIYNHDFLDQCQKVQKEIQTLSQKYPDLHIVVGSVQKNFTGQGKPYKNVALVIKDGVVIDTYQKQLQPFYDVFDEGRYFEPGNTTSVITINGVRYGIAICEDAWNDKMGDDIYNNNPLEKYDKAGTDFLLTLNASPYHIGKPAKRIKMLHETVRKHDFIGIFYANLIGGQDELIFDGHSCLVVANGFYMASPEFNLSTVGQNANAGCIDFSQIKIIDIEHDKKFVCTLDLLIMAIRDYLNKTNHHAVIVGNSGGIDSAAALGLSRLALSQSDNIVSVRMPTEITSGESNNLGSELCSKAKIQDRCVSINHLDFLDHINNGLGLSRGKYHPVADENIQARIRGQILMHMSNANPGYLVLSTGNKTESAFGYCTLYGDMSGGIAPLLDCYKKYVFYLAKQINARSQKQFGQSIIPEGIINRPPTAELAENQDDQNSLGASYTVLDMIVMSYVEHYITSYSSFKDFCYEVFACPLPEQDQNQFFSPKKNHIIPDEIKNALLDGHLGSIKEENHVAKKILDEVKNLGQSRYNQMKDRIDRMQFKRKQAPIGFKICSRSFGFGRRIPIVKG